MKPKHNTGRLAPPVVSARPPGRAKEGREGSLSGRILASHDRGSGGRPGRGRYPFEVAIPAGYEVSGVVLSDQVKSLDWRARRAELICTLPKDTIDEVVQKLSTLILLDAT